MIPSFVVKPASMLINIMQNQASRLEVKCYFRILHHFCQLCAMFKMGNVSYYLRLSKALLEL
jgi:hypothetical protein